MAGDDDEDMMETESSSSDDGTEFTRYAQDFETEKQLGMGGYGRAYFCTHRLDGGQYVVKLVPFEEKDKEKKLSEVRALKKSQHSHVVRYYQSWIEEGTLGESSSSDPEAFVEDGDSSTLFIAMDYCPRSLRDWMRKDFDRNKIMSYFRQLMEGLAHLHEQGVVHGDIKPENLLLDQNGHLRIIDFGFLFKGANGWSLMDENNNIAEISTTYKAPEFKTMTSGFTAAVDVYSAGLVLMEMGRQPIETQHEKNDLFSQARELHFPMEIQEAWIQQALRVTLLPDPIRRWTAKEIISKLLISSSPAHHQ